MKDHYLQLFTYENWAMQKIISILQECQEKEAIEMFQHILLARELWFNRVADQNNPYIFEGKSLRESVESYTRNQAEWIKFLETVEDFERIIAYKNLKGDPFSDKLKNILTHVVNHSTYHRGQITSILKGKVKLESTDFIFFSHEK
jgi:uncharacterized damage-inducible protein DinB